MATRPMTKKDLARASIKISDYASKRERGFVIIIGGSRDYHGAPVLAANAAYNLLASLRVGAGYAILYTPKAVMSAARVLTPNIIVKQLTGLAAMEEHISKANATAIGMGLGRERGALNETAKIIEFSVKNDKKMVVDGDALYAVRLVRGRLSKKIVLTPHDREFYELSGIRLPEKDLEKRVDAAKALASRLNCIILLKGHRTVVTDGKEVRVNTTKSPALATMGTGDVLSGIISGYQAIGCDAFTAAVAGAYLHGLIGDRLNRSKGNHILAVDVVDEIPGVLKKFDKK